MKNYIEIIFKAWDALQFSVQQQTGGSESYAISKWMVDVTDTFFIENENLYPDEVAEFLSTIMDKELNTLVDDESDCEIAELLCRVFKYHNEGNVDAITNILSHLPKSQNNSTHYNIQSQDDDREMGADDGVEIQMTQLNLNNSSMEPNVNSVNDSDTSTNDRENAANSMDNSENVETDGWTVIRRKKNK